MNHTVPVAVLDDADTHELRILEAEARRIDKLVEKVSYDRKILEAKSILFMHGLRKNYDLPEKAFTIRGNEIYTLEVDDASNP